MKKAEIINSLEKKIKHNAYMSRIFDEIQSLDYDVNMMRYERDIHRGKAFVCIELLLEMGYNIGDELWDVIVEEAKQDIIKTNYNIVKLLNLVGYKGEEHYKNNAK